MTGPEREILNPIELGWRAALAVLRPAAPDDRHAFGVDTRAAVLNEAATSLGLFGQSYRIESKRGLTMPKTPRMFSLEDILRHGDENDGELYFNGAFVSYSWFQIGKIVGSSTLRKVSGLCAAFEDPLILSGMDRVDDDRYLHVPLLAVETVEPVSDYI